MTSSKRFSRQRTSDAPGRQLRALDVPLLDQLPGTTWQPSYLAGALAPGLSLLGLAVGQPRAGRCEIYYRFHHGQTTNRAFKHFWYSVTYLESRCRTLAGIA